MKYVYFVNYHYSYKKHGKEYPTEGEAHCVIELDEFVDSQNTFARLVLAVKDLEDEPEDLEKHVVIIQNFIMLRCYDDK